MEELKTLKKKINIRRIDVEKFFVATQQIFTPIRLGQKFRIDIEYNPELPTVEIRFFEE